MVDRIQISGPRSSDGAYKITFETGEYVVEDIAKLLVESAKQQNYKVSVKVVK